MAATEAIQQVSVLVDDASSGSTEVWEVWDCLEWIVGHFLPQFSKG